MSDNGYYYNVIRERISYGLPMTNETTSNTLNKENVEEKQPFQKLYRLHSYCCAWLILELHMPYPIRSDTGFATILKLHI